MKFNFERNKYGREMLIDSGQISEVKGFTKDDTPFLAGFHEIFVITSGEGVFKLDSEVIGFRPGTVILAPPNKWRQWAILDGQLDGHILIFEEEFISRFFNDGLFLFRFHYFYNNSSPSFIQLAEGEVPYFLDRLREVRQELSSLSADSDHFLRSILYYLLIYLNRTYQQQFAIPGQFFEHNLTLRFRKLLEKEIRDHQDVTHYTDKLQVSKSHLNKTLKKNLGKSTAELIKERLLAEAKRELLYRKVNISEISYDLNFSAPANFNRFFKDMTGLTPKEYRRQKSK